MGLKKCFGIISYFCWEQPERTQRQNRLDRLIKQLSELWPDIDILIIAQQWNKYEVESKTSSKVIRYNYDKLGILGARKELRKRFLELGYDYLIMIDDDAFVSYADETIPKKYMEFLDANPDKFCIIKAIPQNDEERNLKYNPYPNTQLSLCAVSRFIFLKEDFPNVDPQINDGFEDRVFSCLLHQKYADRELNCPYEIRCTQFRNVALDKEIGTCPSTWSRARKFNWTLMKSNTINIEEYLATYKDLPDYLKTGIDIVVPYVDASDKNWQELFKKYNPKTTSEAVNAINRFRGQGDFFRYFFRSVEKNLPLVHNVFLLVQSESQVPTWINRKTVKVITHDQFIPKEYLPTFNSCTIEMFLWNIPGLSEYFLYFNDDVFTLAKLIHSRIFSGKYVKDMLTSRPVTGLFAKHCKNCADLIYGNGIFKRCEHDFRPYIKSKMIECFNLYKPQILRSISRFRTENNYNGYLYTLYLDKLGLMLQADKIEQYNMPRNYDLTDKDIICLNDANGEVNMYEDARINDIFFDIFVKKSKYEQNDFSSSYTKARHAPPALPKKAEIKNKTSGIYSVGWGFNF